MKIILKIFTVYIILLLINIYAHYPEKNFEDIFTMNFGIFLELLILNIIILFFSFIKNKRLRITLISITLLVYYSVYILQIFSIDITGDIINLAALHNANQFMLLLNNNILLKGLIYILLFFFILKVILSTLPLSSKHNMMTILSIIILGILIFSYKKTYYIHGILPMKNFLQVVEFYIEQRTHHDNSILTLNKKDIAIAKKFNIAIDLNGTDPFEKKMIYRDSLPFKVKSRTKPNIIVFFVESLSARLLGSYNQQMRTVTPHIDDFTKNAMVVHGYYNHATPTAPALYGQHCSLYPLFTYDDMNQLYNPLNALHLKCMPQYFKENGYHTLYFSHSRKNYSHIKDNLKIWGYQKSYLWKNFLHTYLKNEDLILGENGLSDHQMMRGLVHYLEQDTNQPFLIGVSTIETHMGLNPNSVDGLKYKDGNNNTLNMIYNFDDAFNIFWQYFKHSKYYQNTIVVITGDHALYPNTDYQKIAGNDWISSVYDDLSLIIYDPIHTLPKDYFVNATSVDLAPSLLHLAGIKKDTINSFMGNSIFETKEYNNSFGISAYPDFNCYLNINGKIFNQKEEHFKDSKTKDILKSLKRIIKYFNTTRKN